MSKQLNTLWTFVGLLFFMLIFTLGSKGYVLNQLENPRLNLTDDDIRYASRILDIDLTGFDEVDTDILESNELDVAGDSAGSSLKDFALEFFYSKSQAEKVTANIKDIFLFITYIFTYLKIPINFVSFVVLPLNWLINLGLLFGGIFFIRGVK